MRNVPRLTATTTTKTDVEALIDSCVLLRSAAEHHWLLFGQSNARHALLEEIAPVFFGDIHAILRDQIFLGVCRITDPAVMLGRENLTIKSLLANSDFTGDQEVGCELHELSDKIHEFRKKIVVARHRRISHLDRAAAQSDEWLGAAPQADWDHFWKNLDRLLCLLHRKFLDRDGIFHLNEIGIASDCDALVKALKESRFFLEALSQRDLTHRIADIANASRYADA